MAVKAVFPNKPSAHHHVEKLTSVFRTLDMHVAASMKELPNFAKKHKNVDRRETTRGKTQF
eukprot:3425054-Rhodomonas_salina.1